MKTAYFISLFILVASCNTGKQDTSQSEKLNQSDVHQLQEEKVLFADNNDSLVHIIINEPPVKYCEIEHHHFVDIVAKRKIDSLKKKEVKSILFIEIG